MQTRIVKKRITTALLFAALSAVLLLALIFGCAPVKANAAGFESGSLIDYNVEKPDSSVVLDVNGKVMLNATDTNSGAVETNNSSGYSTRNIYVSALHGYNGNNTYVLNNIANDGTSTDIYNYSENYFTVKVAGTSGNDATLCFTAKAYTGNLPKTPRIAIVLANANNPDDKVKVLIDVTVNASAPATLSENTIQQLYVGDLLNADRKSVSSLNTTEAYKFPIELKNNTKIEIDLYRYLLGRKLYFASSNDSQGNPLYTFDSTHAISVPEVGATDFGTAGTNVLKNDTNQGEYLTFNDLSTVRLATDEAHKPAISTGEDGWSIEYYESGNNAQNLRFVISLDITTSDMKLMNLNGAPLWKDDGSFFEMSLCLQMGTAYLRVRIPVVFLPSDAPKALTVYNFDTSLNAGSTYTSYEDIMGEHRVNGYNTVRIYPEDICDFPSYDNYDDPYNPLRSEKIHFISEFVPTPTGNNIVSINAGEDDNGNVYYDVTGLANGRSDITFRVYYRIKSLDFERSYISVRVPFTVYGQYDVTFNIAGAKARTFTIDSSMFRALKDAQYQIVGASVFNRNSEDTQSYANVSYSNGVITVSPRLNADSDDKVGVVVTLVNMQGQRIELDCKMVIDLTANDFFYGWATWAKVLFWIGIGLAAALFILFIVWLFLRSLHRHKIDELETTAPTSAYIIKLNSTIAAAQAQHKLASQSYAPQQNNGMAPNGQMLQLGAGPASTPVPNPNTLQLGATNPNTQQMSQPAYSMGTTVSFASGAPIPSQSAQTSQAAQAPYDDIYIPISDEDLLQRIYEEKFEPRGMLKRTFDKSKDLQQRELEKEKERIREEVRNGVSIEEACKSLKQRGIEAVGLTRSMPADAPEEPQVDPLIAILGFDPADPIVADVKREEPQEDWLEEYKKFKEAEYNNLRIAAELAIIESRIEAISSANEKTESDLSGANIALEELAFGIKETEQKLDDKNTDLAVERRKSAKEALNKEIAELEAKIKADKEAVAKRKFEVESGSALLEKIKELSSEYAGKKEATDALMASSVSELEAARAEADKAAELAAKAKHQAELKIKLETLNPMMETVNLLDGEINVIADSIANSTAEKDSRKTAVSALQTELLSTTDSSKITQISENIKDLNKEISELDRTATANTTLKTNKGIEFASIRRKANEFIEKEGVELEEVIAAEDEIIGKIALDKLLKQTEEEKNKAEEAVAHWQNVCDSLTENLDSSVMESAAETAQRIKTAEEELASAKASLEELDAKIEAATDDDEKLNLTMEQATLSEQIATLTTALEEARAEGIKSNLEHRTKGEEEIENAREELNRAKEDFERASEHFHEVSTNVNPLDLITSGSGIISQDRKKIEAENLKKILEEQKKATEQANLQAQIARQEAEKAVADAQRASEESKAEAERLAQEALERAEAAREEAEQKARDEAERARLEAQEEIERARLEAEESKRLAEEEVERARKAAEEEAERLRSEMEESKRLAEEENERIRKESEEEAERLRKESEEEAERIRRETEEEAERKRLEEEEARKAAEEEAERKRLEEEEARKSAEEEAERKRLEEEENARKVAEEEAKNKARIDEKIAKRKAEIAVLRSELKNITEEEQGNALREKFYAIQLALDDEEKTSTELTDLLAKSMDDASHAAELSRYKKLANQKPKRIVKKVTERVNRIPKSKRRPSARPGARPAARPGARPAARPGARPAARPGARPAARPGARPAARPGTRHTSRPSGRTPSKK